MVKRVTNSTSLIMKISVLLYTASAVVAAGLLVSCDTGNGLARQIEGAWQGTPQAITTSEAGILTMTDEWNFIADEAKGNGGDLIITSMASVEWPLTIAGDSIAPQSDPYAVTLSAVVSLNATWDLDPHDPDEDILVSIDPKTLSVTFDPDAVTVSANGNPVTLDSIPASIYGEARRELIKAAQTRFFPVNQLEDVEIKKGSVKFEIPSGIPKHDDVKVRLNKVADVSR